MLKENAYINILYNYKLYYHVHRMNQCHFAIFNKDIEREDTVQLNTGYYHSSYIPVCLFILYIIIYRYNIKTHDIDLLSTVVFLLYTGM